jgi:excisionase family DNA binding protein
VVRGTPITTPSVARSSGHLCSVAEAAEHLGVSVRFVRRLVAERRIRHIKVGRYVRFDRADLETFIAAGVREPADR